MSESAAPTESAAATEPENRAFWKAKDEALKAQGTSLHAEIKKAITGESVHLKIRKSATSSHLA